MNRTIAIVASLFLFTTSGVYGQSVAESIQNLSTRVNRLETVPASTSAPSPSSATGPAKFASTTFGGSLLLNNTAGNLRAKGDLWTNGGYFEAINSSGNSVAWLGASSTTGGLVALSNPSGKTVTKLNADDKGMLQLFDAAGEIRAKVDVWNSGGFLEVFNAASSRVLWIGSSSLSSGIVELSNKSSKVVARLEADTTGDGQLTVANANGVNGVLLRTGGDGDQGGWASFNNQSGAEVAYIGVGKSGRGLLTINGANVGDYSEWFEADTSSASPGTVMCSTDAGRLTPCETPLAATVVGVVSGAGTLSAGIALGEEGSDRAQIAMAGQVYVRCRFVNGIVRVGDLLVAGGDGVAIPVRGQAAPPGTVVGKALETKTDAADAIQLIRMLVLNR